MGLTKTAMLQNAPHPPSPIQIKIILPYYDEGLVEN